MDNYLNQEFYNFQLNNLNSYQKLFRKYNINKSKLHIPLFPHRKIHLYKGICLRMGRNFLTILNYIKCIDSRLDQNITRILDHNLNKYYKLRLYFDK